MKALCSAIGVSLGLLALGGCAASPGLPDPSAASGAVAAGDQGMGFTADNQVVFSINKQQVTMGQFLPALLKAYGVKVMLPMAELEMVKQDAAQEQITVSVADIAAQRRRTLDQLFVKNDDDNLSNLHDAENDNKPLEVAKIRKKMDDEHETLLKSYLVQMKNTPGEFDLVIEMDAYLRKLAEAQIAKKNPITDEVLEQQFAALYGEQVRVKAIELANMLEVAQAQGRIARGEPFAQVAREMSRDHDTRVNGGDMQPFSMRANIPKQFKEVAFDLKVGQVSEPVKIGDFYCLIQLQERIPQKVVKFKDVKDDLRKSATEAAINEYMQQWRRLLVGQVVQSLQVDNPILNAQYQEMVAATNKSIHDRAAATRALEAERRAATQPSSQPSTRRFRLTP